MLIGLTASTLTACQSHPLPPTPTKPPAPLETPQTHSPVPTPKTRSPVPTPAQGSHAPLPKAAASRLYLPLISGGKNSPILTPALPITLTAKIPTTTIPINLGGLHVEGVGDHTGYEDFLRACSAANRPVALIKVYGDGYSAKIAKTIDSRTVTIWRKPVKVGHDEYEDNPPGNWNWPANETADIARRWMETMYPTWETQADPYIDYFEIVNEPNPATMSQTQRAADFMMAAMQEAEQHNPPYRLAIWSFSSGTPEPWQIEIILPSLRYAAEHGHILAVHDGSVDAERPLFRQAYKDGTAFRYRMFQPMLGASMPRVAVTEAYQPGGNVAPDWYDWQWYLTEMAKDNVIGVAWFTLGPYSFDGITDVNVVKQLPAFALTLGCK